MKKIGKLNFNRLSLEGVDAIIQSGDGIYYKGVDKDYAVFWLAAPDGNGLVLHLVEKYQPTRTVTPPISWSRGGGVPYTVNVGPQLYKTIDARFIRAKDLEHLQSILSWHRQRIQKPFGHRFYDTWVEIYDSRWFGHGGDTFLSGNAILNGAAILEGAYRVAPFGNFFLEFDAWAKGQGGPNSNHGTEALKSLGMDIAFFLPFGAAARTLKGTKAGYALLAVSSTVDVGLAGKDLYNAYDAFSEGNATGGWTYMGSGLLQLAGVAAANVAALKTASKVVVDSARTAAPKIARATLRILDKTCFVAGTPVLTPEGSRLIEELKVGDEILSRPEDRPADPIRSRTVEALFELEAPLLELRLGGQVIETTAEHPFYVADTGWVRAEQLQLGDMLVGHDDRSTPVDSIAKLDRHEAVYNIRVAEDHTYFVGQADWGFSVWVHNAYTVNSLANGLFEVVDDVGVAVRTGLRNLQAANKYAKFYNSPGLQFPTDFFRKLHGGRRISSITGRQSSKISALKAQYPDLADIPNQINKKTDKAILDRIEKKAVDAFANNGFELVDDPSLFRLFNEDVIVVRDGYVDWYFNLDGKFRSVFVH